MRKREGERDVQGWGTGVASLPFSRGEIRCNPHHEGVKASVNSHPCCLCVYNVSVCVYTFS